MLLINRDFAVIKVALATLSALMCAITLLALAAVPARAASSSGFTCRASALRVEGLPALNVLDAEPAIANSLTDPCASEHTAIANAPPGLSTLLATGTGEASATTTSASTSGSAAAQVANATVLAAVLGLHADAATATARYSCAAGAPTPQASSSVANLSLGGGAPITSGQPVSLPLGGLADVELNRTITTATSVTQRAVDITVLGGVFGGVHIVLGEATAGISGNPCAGQSGPPVDTTPPVISGTPTAGHTLSCSTGTWTGDPTLYTYQWSREGTPIVGATQQTYTVITDDEGVTLTCTVTAFNAAGAGSPATSRGVSVKVPYVRGCPRAIGKLTAQTLGPLRLGMTRQQARRADRRSSTRGRRYWDFFCLTPRGVRLAYASDPRLLRTLSPSMRRSVQGHGVLALTANAFYDVGGVRHGATLTSARQRLGRGQLFRVGLNFWFLARHGSSTAVLKVRHGIVEEVGIADARLTRTPKAQRIFMKRFP